MAHLDSNLHFSSGFPSPISFHPIQSHRRTQSVPVHGLPRPFASFGAPGDWPRDSATPQRWHGCVQPTILRGNRGAVPQTLATHISREEMTTTQLLYIYVIIYIYIYVYIILINIYIYDVCHRMKLEFLEGFPESHL